MSDTNRYCAGDINSGLQSLGIGLLNILHNVAWNKIEKYEYEIPKYNMLLEFDMSFLVAILGQMKIVDDIEVKSGNKIVVHISEIDENESVNYNTIDIKKKGNLIIFTKG